MKIMTLKKKAQYALATAAVTVMAAPAMADGSLMDTIKAELADLKAGVLAIGAVVIGIGIAFATIRVAKRGSNQVG